MPLSWNEIKHRAIAFSKEWKGETREAAERQSFWNDFLNVFGIKRRVVASFEEPVKKLSGHWGSIDLLWPGTLIVEHKSAGEDLDKADSRRWNIFGGCKNPGRAKTARAISSFPIFSALPFTILMALTGAFRSRFHWNPEYTSDPVEFDEKERIHHRKQVSPRQDVGLE
jgi:hypothetical protein